MNSETEKQVLTGDDRDKEVTPCNAGNSANFYPMSVGELIEIAMRAQYCKENPPPSAQPPFHNG